MSNTVQSQVASIGAGRSIESTNDPRIMGTYRDNTEAMSEQQKSVLSTKPLAVAQPPFTVRGG